ncbi:hypothetical protein lhe_0277 [Lactobacillus helveticus CNRZ32]|nr:hypothetical protein lhe_0277 [Lactobacillus helveticus CNRZ32]EEW68259.1 hypothetical protein HMPREF0518_0768 [Lactobacillus helveticus DSM 20075 = CGMCC 1.1877]
MRYPKMAYTFSADYFSTPESVDPFILQFLTKAIKLLKGIVM